MTRSREEERAYRRGLRARKKAAAAAAATASPSPKPKRKVHAAAVTRMLKATGLAHIPEEAPLVELVKSLAAQLDAGGDSAIAARYRAALGDVRKVLAYSGRPKASADPTSASESPSLPAAAEPVAPVNSLAAFKAARGID